MWYVSWVVVKEEEEKARHREGQTLYIHDFLIRLPYTGQETREKGKGRKDYKGLHVTVPAPSLTDVNRG